MYAPANSRAVDAVDPAMREHLPSSYADVTVARDDIWLDANYGDIEARFEAWLSERAADGPEAGN